MAVKMMKGGVNLKVIIILVILVLVGVLAVLGMNTVKTFLGGAAADVEPKEVMAKSNEDGRGAVVTWKSDKDSMGVVEYGTTPASLLLRSAETEAATSHQVNLTPLRPNVNYYFRIRIGEEVYDNAGIPYSFKTNGNEEAVATVAPVSVPTVTPAAGGGSCDKNGDGRVSSVELLNCKQVSPTPDPCDTDKDGRVSSVEKLKCSR